MSTPLRVPASGESIQEVYIGGWRKAEGESVREGEAVVELESDKATLELASPVSGTLVRILKREGETAAVGEVIGYIEESGAGIQGAPAAPGTVSSVPEATLPPGTVSSGAPSPPSAPHVMPAAEKTLAERGLRADDVVATGPGNRLLKEDVLRHAPSTAGGTGAAAARPEPPGAGASQPLQADPFEEAPGREEHAVPMSPIRLRIAERLVTAQREAALLTTFNEIDMTAVVELRKKYQEAFVAEHGVKLGFMSFFVKATIDALKRIPQLNAVIRDRHIVYRNYYDIGIAIGAGRGLVVPVLRNADRMSFAEIEQAIADMARRAAENKLTVEELQGGTFTISNGGVYGSLLSTPIVNPPQSGILGLHAIQDRPVALDGQVVIRKMMYVALTYDHRIIDGREAVTFLKRIKEVIEAPERLLLDI